jgi:hypothetical protein
MTTKTFFAAITHIGSPIFGIGSTPEEALHDARGDQDPTAEHLPVYVVYQCSAALYDRVIDIGPDVVYMSINGRLILPGEL